MNGLSLALIGSANSGTTSEQQTPWAPAPAMHGPRTVRSTLSGLG